MLDGVKHLLLSALWLEIFAMLRMTGEEVHPDRIVSPQGGWGSGWQGRKSSDERVAMGDFIQE